MRIIIRLSITWKIEIRLLHVHNLIKQKNLTSEQSETRDKGAFVVRGSLHV